MEKIEERAEKFADANYITADCFDAAYHGYIKGATEQKQIDIDKACEWFLSQIDYDNTGRECRVFFRDAVDRFRKAMEE